jgi:hypothetical protein
MHKRLLLKVRLLATALLLMASAAQAGVVVSASGNTAIANISLSSGGHTYAATVTIDFTGAQNLNPTELNLSAQLVDPLDPGLLSRLPACILPVLGCVTIDPNFPVLVTVEPLNLGAGNLSFKNTYDFELHTANLVYVPYSRYRLFKAPVTGAFVDTTSAVESGSVRARGRGGTFSQFLVVADTRASLLVETGKELALTTRILASALSGNLLNTLLGLLGNVESAVAMHNYTLAISNLDQLINTIRANAGTSIANTWNPNHLMPNDAGEMLGLAQTLRFTLVLLQNGH